MLQIRALPPTFPVSQRPFQAFIPPSSPLGINYNINFPSKPFSLTPTKHFPIPFAFHSHTQTTGATATVSHEAVVVDSDSDTSNGHNDLRFVDVGHLIGIHGFEGEIRVKPITDFPELRFSNPGKRWLKLKVLDGERVQQVELEEGWEQPGQNCWVLRFRGINTVEQAKMLIGATLLVTEEDRPELEEGEVYTRDLIGMRVIMKVCASHEHVRV